MFLHRICENVLPIDKQTQFDMTASSICHKYDFLKGFQIYHIHKYLYRTDIYYINIYIYIQKELFMRPFVRQPKTEIVSLTG